MTSTSKTLAAAMLALSFGLVGATAMAQDNAMSSAAHKKTEAMAQSHKSTKKMHGVHTMPATVTSVDKATGIVEVKSEGMDLKVHFPPPSVAELKDGDKIVLHLGYSM